MEIEEEGAWFDPGVGYWGHMLNKCQFKIR